MPKKQNITEDLSIQSIPRPQETLPPIEQKSTSVRNRLKDNKVLFYGIPVIVVCLILGGLMLFVLPTIEYYSTYQSEKQAIEKNSSTVNKSIHNLNTVYERESEVKSYDTTLSEFVPVEPKLGEIITMIQTKAKDFNLESKVATNTNTANTSVDNLAKKSEGTSLFESITSGEITFQPKSLHTADVDAVLLSIEVNVKGDREAFLNFLSEMKDVKPIINLVFVEYSESHLANTTPTVTALLRFESYALKLDTDSLKLAAPKQLKNDDPLLIRTMQEEKFEINEEIAQTLQALSQQKE